MNNKKTQAIIINIKAHSLIKQMAKERNMSMKSYVTWLVEYDYEQLWLERKNTAEEHFKNKPLEA